MCMIIAAFSFFYAYISYQGNNMTSFYIAIGVGIIFIALMINNIFRTRKQKRLPK